MLDTDLSIYVINRRPRRGEVIGPNDLHIAAHARSEALTLVTNNQREFDRVDGLRTARWV